MDLKYRPEIDGLRAIAVLAVIFFHAGFGIFRGGFVGVDIFFVISGFLITSIIVKDVEAGKFSFWEFYERRARRILPALFLVLLCCIPFAWMWMLPRELVDFSISVVDVCLFVSNILFWQQSGYFDTASELKPLLHTWSLAVEEQFYIIFPIALLLMFRWGRGYAIWAIAALAALSLGASEFASRHDPSFNFYFLPTRAWELMAGALCSFVTTKASPVRDTILSTGGLIAIGISIFGFEPTIPTPSLYALVPVLGACTILLLARQGTFVGALLSFKPLSWIGLVSYSAYLWHQPLFAFTRLRWLVEPSWQMKLMLCAASFALAYLSWRFVEIPFRRRNAWPHLSRRSIFALCGIVSVTFITFGIAGSLSNGFNFLNRLDDKTRNYARFAYGYNTGYFNSDCFLTSGRNSFALFKKDKCLSLSDVKPNVLIMGDSHAADLVRAIANVFPEVNILQATSSGCRPLLPLRGETRCTDMANFMINDFLAHNRVDAVILSANWGIKDSGQLSDTISTFKNFTPNVIVLGPTMTYTTDLPRILISLHRSGYTDLSAAVSKFTISERWKINQAMRDVAQSNGAHFIDVLAGLCPNGTCRVVTDNDEPMAFDTAHFTETGAKTIVYSLRLTGSFNAMPLSVQDGPEAPIPAIIPTQQQ